MLGIDETDYLIEVREGKIQRIAEGLTPNDMGFDFALKAPSGAWTKFAQPIPPPMFNDIWAMAHPLHRQLQHRRQHPAVLAEPAGADAHARADAASLNGEARQERRP